MLYTVCINVHLQKKYLTFDNSMRNMMRWGEIIENAMLILIILNIWPTRGFRLAFNTLSAKISHAAHVNMSPTDNVLKYFVVGTYLWPFCALFLSSHLIFLFFCFFTHLPTFSWPTTFNGLWQYPLLIKNNNSNNYAKYYKYVNNCYILIIFL